ncbi:MAG: RnfABCDGE type electron transport complex subunit B [bacterium]
MLIITSIIVLGMMGLIFAGLLGFAARYYRVEEDPRVASIMAILPGANCGACGVAGCHTFADKVSKGEIAVSGCLVGGMDVAKKIAAIMGEEGFEVHKKVAVVHCGAKKDQKKKKANYIGVKTCIGASLIDNGGLLCSYGCMGYGDCACICPFNAIKMVDGLPVIDPEKCTACGKCIKNCPKKIIALKPYDFKAVVACSSRDRGAETRKNCPVGCIACKICEKAVPEVFKVTDNLAVIDHDKKGIDCSAAIEKCPTKCIVKA